MGKLAVVLFNLGGPDSLNAVRPFLFNLFNDPAIIGAPTAIRYGLAQLISVRRAKVARQIYARLGGLSPLLANTLAQAAALEHELADLGDVRVWPAMRYWHPMSEAVAREVHCYGAHEIVLLPLYPQFSTTTTGSSARAWAKAAASARLSASSRQICCYPGEPGFVRALVELMRPALARAAAHGRPRVLFSAHGLPKRIVARGDPYPWQVEQSAAAVVRELAIPNLDAAVCYQSQVGPLEWIGPYTEAEIRRAGADKIPLVVVPIAFVSEHSETLVELDMDYRRLTQQAGVPHFEWVATVSTHPAFIAGLARLVRSALARPPGTFGASGEPICPVTARQCAMVQGG